MANLSASVFALLTAHLDRDSIAAADRPENLCSKPIECLAWKGVPASQAGALAGVVIDRVALKLEAGEVTEIVAGLTRFERGLAAVPAPREKMAKARLIAATTAFLFINNRQKQAEIAALHGQIRPVGSNSNGRSTPGGNAKRN